MTRKKARHLLLEMMRRQYLQEHGTLQGFGKVARFYGRSWRPDLSGDALIRSYRGAWEWDVMQILRKRVGM